MSAKFDPDAELSYDKRKAVEAAFSEVRALHNLGYTEMNANPIHLDLFRRFALGLVGDEVLGATGSTAGSEEKGTQGTYAIITDEFLVQVTSSEPGRDQSYSSQGPLVEFVGPIMTPLSKLAKLEVTGLQFSHDGVPDIEFQAHFTGVEEPVLFTRSLAYNEKVRRRVYYFLRDVLARK